MLRNSLGLGMLLNTKSYRRGRMAAHEGLGLADNPFAEGSSLAADWALGWRIAVRMAEIEERRAIARPVPGQSAFEAGWEAAGRGAGAGANPYPSLHPDHAAWRLGWARRKAG